jgi:hypothetical protein
MILNNIRRVLKGERVMVQLFELGDRLRDKVTGDEGYAVAQVEYIDGTVRYLIKKQLNIKTMEKGLFLDKSRLVDSQRLELVNVIDEKRRRGSK